jgi:hypothetical protein
MALLKELEDTTNDLQRLLAVLAPLDGHEGPPAVTADWTIAARQLLERGEHIMADSAGRGLQGSEPMNRYRAELLRLKKALESSQQRLMSQRAVIQAEQGRLRKLRELTETLQTLG